VSTSHPLVGWIDEHVTVSCICEHRIKQPVRSQTAIGTVAPSQRSWPYYRSPYRLLAEAALTCRESPDFQVSLMSIEKPLFGTGQRLRFATADSIPCHMRPNLMALLVLLIAAAPPSRWLRLSDTDQGPRYINLASVKRFGDRASVDTELRMRPTLTRREQFRCSRRLILADMFMPKSTHDLTLQPAGKTWMSIKDHQDGLAMFKVACGRHR
jgi:hypothetical protein